MKKIKPILLFSLIIALIAIVVVNFPTSDLFDDDSNNQISSSDEIEDLESGNNADNAEDPETIDNVENNGANLTSPTGAKTMSSKLVDGILFKTAEIKPNQGLFQALMDVGLNTNEALKIINGFRFEVELISLRAGAQFKIGMKVLDSTKYTNDPNVTTYDSVKIMSVSYKKNAALYHHLELNKSDSLVYRKEELKTKYEYRFYTNSLKPGSSLNNMLLDAGIPPNLTQTVNGVLLCKISFRTDAQPNDEFKVLIRNTLYKDTLIEGKVLYTSYNGVSAGFHQAFRYDDGDKSSYTAHYTFDGEALVHSGLRYPVDRLLISSNYGWRIHPVTGGRKFHYGIDYAAGNNNPIYAVAPGKVIKSTRDKYSGNYVAIRHADKSVSYYLHMSRRLVNVGANVRSKQIIGRVGSTGRVTGPHLHFGIKKPNGKWMNPNQKRMIATPKLEGVHYDNLRKQIDAIFPILSDLESEHDYNQRMKEAGWLLTEKERKALEFNEHAIDDTINSISSTK